VIRNAGQLVQFIEAAVKQHGATPQTEIRVRVGALGPTYRINMLKGAPDQRGFSLVLELMPFPESI
jgi:hypothetical protein